MAAEAIIQPQIHHFLPESLDTAIHFYSPVFSDSRCQSLLFVFIHGGAWVSGSPKEGNHLIQKLLQLFPGASAASIDYRLSPHVRHPIHIQDCVKALACLAQARAPKEGWRMILIGHSVGAWLAFSIALNSATEVPGAVTNAVKAVVGIDGIYDIPELLKEYPTYDRYVSPAFGDLSEFHAAASVTQLSTLRQGIAELPVLLLHSPDDELLTSLQTKLMQKHLAGLSNLELQVDLQAIRGTHDGLLLREELPNKIASWVAAEGMA